MSFQQLPKLFLRGSMMNVTAKNLTEEQKAEVTAVMDTVWTDPNFQGAKHAFCDALKNTIGGEYKSKEAAEQEARIAIYRAAISILYHDKKLEPSDRIRIKSDPINRKKYFTNYLWMYLRQILRENKIPAIKSSPVISGPASFVAAKAIMALIEFKHENVEFEEKEHYYKIADINQNMWPLALTLDINNLIKQYKEYGITVNNTNSFIEIIGNTNEPTIDGVLVRSLRIKEVSFDHKINNDNDELRYTIEFKMLDNNTISESEKPIDESDSIKVLKNRIPQSIVPIVELIVNPPNNFINQYGDKIPKKSHISKYLGISVKDVEEAYRLLRVHTKLLELV